jgi:DNA end-binding protein Ku
MERTGRVAIGKFVMRDHEYLVAILSEDGILRAETLRHADEIRSPETVGLPKVAKAAAKTVSEFAKEIEHLTRKELDPSELEDDAARALQKLAQSKLEKDQDVIEQGALEDEEEPVEQGAKIIDFMEVLRKRVAQNAAAHTGEDGEEKPRPTAKSSRSEPAAKKTAARAKTARHSKREEDLAHSTIGELQKMASELHIQGRSKMDRSKLIKAIRDAD